MCIRFADIKVEPVLDYTVVHCVACVISIHCWPLIITVVCGRVSRAQVLGFVGSGVQSVCLCVVMSVHT